MGERGSRPPSERALCAADAAIGDGGRLRRSRAPTWLRLRRRRRAHLDPALRAVVGHARAHRVRPHPERLHRLGRHAGGADVRGRALLRLAEPPLPRLPAQPRQPRVQRALALPAVVVLLRDAGLRLRQPGADLGAHRPRRPRRRERRPADRALRRLPVQVCAARRHARVREVCDDVGALLPPVCAAGDHQRGAAVHAVAVLARAPRGRARDAARGEPDDLPGGPRHRRGPPAARRRVSAGEPQRAIRRNSAQFGAILSDAVLSHSRCTRRRSRTSSCRSSSR